MEAMTLAQIRQKCNVSRRAIQGYEKSGLVKSTGKTKRGYLTYDEETVQRILDIKFYQSIGLQIKEIVSVIDASDDVIRKSLVQRRTRLIIKKAEIIQLIEMIEQKISRI